MSSQQRLSCGVRSRTAGSACITRTLRHDGDLRIPSCEDLDQFALKAAGRFTRLVDLTCHDSGASLIVEGPAALPRSLTEGASVRFPEALQVSVRGGLLRDPAEVDRVAAEVSAMLLEADGGAG